jgi:class 3 adenylate cyclase/pimeloyl-ACP methyl ester carboxylesterase
VADPTEQRQLLAIMFTDVVGYTALTERDEAAAVRVRDQSRDLIRTLVGQFDGDVVDATGDESLSIFPSALRAVDCALALQGALRSHTDLRLRIGIHLGDVLRRGGEVIGEGVNVAARIRPLAEPGGICVSEPVHQMVRSRAHVTTHSLGAQELKNVGTEVPVYSLAASDGQTPGARPRRRRGPMVLVGALAAALLVAALAFTNGAAIVAWLALNVPRLGGGSVEQQIGFVETSDGVRIAYATSGEGPPLVSALGWITHLTEGLGSPLYDQGGSIAAASQRGLLVRYDGRGFGLSDRDVTDFSLDARVRDLESVVDALGLERFALNGISAGGPTVITYAFRHPERVSHLILSATFAGFGEPDAASPPLAKANAARRELIRTSWELPSTRAMIAELLAPDLGDVERRVLLHFLAVSGEGPAFAGFMEASFAIDATSEARQLRIPALVISGGDDPLLSGGRELASLIPGARFEVLEGANHIEASAGDPRVRELIADFIAEPAPRD